MSLDLTGHGILKCRCGNVIKQCRCWQHNKQVVTSRAPCLCTAPGKGVMEDKEQKVQTPERVEVKRVVDGQERTIQTASVRPRETPEKRSRWTPENTETR